MSISVLVAGFLCTPSRFHVKALCMHRNDPSTWCLSKIQLSLRQNDFYPWPRLWHFHKSCWLRPAQPHRAQSTGPWTTWDYSCPPYSRNVQHVLLIVDRRSGACPQYLKINTKLHSLKARKTLSYFTSHVFGCKWLVFKLSACVFTSLHQLETLSKPSGLHWSEIPK